MVAIGRERVFRARKRKRYINYSSDTVSDHEHTHMRKLARIHDNRHTVILSLLSDVHFASWDVITIILQMAGECYEQCLRKQ